jgi:hypothetical protein
MCVLQKVGFWKRSMREQFEAETMRRGVVTEELLESPKVPPVDYLHCG